MPVAQRFRKLISYGRDALTSHVDDKGRLGTKRKGHCSLASDLIHSPEATKGHTGTYRYRHLRAAHSIRLLRFLPGSNDRDIRCTIKEYDITSETVLYVALSYVWGDATIQHPIFLDGEIAYITSNLREALTHLGNALPHASFWIDAICIDQSNTAERMRQVGKMRAIYSNAAEVVAWLGPGYTGIGKLSSVIGVHYSNCSWHYMHPVCRCGILIDREIVAAMQHLVRQPYWQRVWIIQEVVMAKKIRIMCGTVTLEWSYFCLFLDDMFQKLLPLAKGMAFDRTELQDRFDSISRLSLWPWKSSILAHALHCSASRLATDGRDKVYAVLGLIDKGAGRFLAADYTLSPCNVYCLAIRAMAVDCGEKRCRCGLHVGMISDACLNDALERDQVSVDGRISAKDGTTLDTGCDGTQCQTQALMQKFANRHYMIRRASLEVPREIVRGPEHW